MKKLLLLTVSIFIWASAMAQVSDSIPQKHDMYIHIVTVDSNSTALMGFGHFLTDNRFQITKIDKDFLSMSTNFFALVIGSFIITGLQANVKGHEITIKIISKLQFPINISDGVDGLDMEYKEERPLRNKLVWEKVLKMLSKFPHTRIYYSQL